MTERQMDELLDKEFKRLYPNTDDSKWEPEETEWWGNTENDTYYTWDGWIPLKNKNRIDANYMQEFSLGINKVTGEFNHVILGFKEKNRRKKGLK